MRKVTCQVCHSTLPQIDLRASFGIDPHLLTAQELARARSDGLNHVEKEHNETYLLAKEKGMEDQLIQISEFQPLDAESRLPMTSRVRR